MRKKHLFRFNLIEIILAMGVVAIGMTAVMALLPPALNANRDAAGDVVAAEIASKMIAYIDMQARFVDQANDAAWKSAFEDKFSNSEQKISGLDDDVLASNETTNKLSAPFSDFVPKSGGLLNYILQENGEDYCAANVIVWYGDIPAPYKYPSPAYPLRSGKRFYIKVSWPGEAPRDADYRQERTFVYDVLRPVSENP